MPLFTTMVENTMTNIRCADYVTQENVLQETNQKTSTSVFGNSHISTQAKGKFCQ